MPVDIHPEKGISGVELILTGSSNWVKILKQQLQVSGGLHRVEYLGSKRIV